MKWPMPESDRLAGWLWRVALCVVGASLVPPALTLLNHLSHARPLPVAAVPGDIAVSEGQTPDLGAILAFAPFGQTNPLADPVNTSTTDLAVSGDFVLLGVTLAQDPARSRAIIAGGATGTASYQPGAVLIQGVTLRSIGPEAIELDWNGEPVWLGFPQADDPIADAAIPLAGASLDFSNLAAPPAAPASLDAMAPELAELIAGYRSDLAQDGAGLLARLDILPTSEGLLFGPDLAADLRAAGFRPGDLVTRINDRAMQDVAPDIAVFDALMATGQLVVTLQRENAALTMTFPLADAG